jgi:hypothetical protein
LSLYAQTKEPDTLQYSPVDSVISKIEKQYQINIFYDREWFEGKEMVTNVLNLPLMEVLGIISKMAELSVLKYDDTYYIFVPQSALTNNNLADSLQYYQVGDILSYGSRDKALVRGSVTNGISADKIVGAKVFVPGINKTFITDYNGRYSMNIPVGEHEIRVNSPGFEEKIMKLKVYSDGNLDMELFVKSIMLEEVAVTSAKVNQYFRRTKMSVMNLDAKSIKQLPSVFGETDIIKGLSLLPGVQTTGEFGSGFNVRGGSSDQNLILLEEVPVFSTSHLFGLISIINPDGVADVTLYKGGLPAMYGERASSILSIKMGDEDLKRTQVKGGIGLLNSRLSLEVPLKDKGKIIVGGRTSYSDWMLRRIPDEDLMNSSAGFNDFNAYFTYNITKRNTVTLYGYSSNDRFNLSGLTDYKYGNMLGSVNVSHRFNSNLYTNILLGTSYYGAAMSENDSLQPAHAYKTQNSILYRSLKWNFIYKLNEDHILTFGTNAFLYRIVPGEMKPRGEHSLVQPVKVQTENGIEWAAFVGDDYKINDNIGLEFGVRYSGFTYLGPKTINNYAPDKPKTSATITDSVVYGKNRAIKTWKGFEPRLLFRFNITTASSLRFSYNRNFQYINLVSKTSVAAPTDLWKLSDNYIKPLQSDQLAVGYFRNMKANRYETSLELYYKVYNNLVDYKNDADIFLNNHIETELVPAKGKSLGLEIYLKKNTGKLTGWVSYTLSESKRRTISAKLPEQVNGNRWYPDNLHRPHNLVINGGYNFNRRWKFGFIFTYNTGRPTSLPELKYQVRNRQIVYYSDRNMFKMPDYHRLDLSVSRFESLRINKRWKGYWTFSLINVYARKNAYSIYYQRDRNPDGYDGRSNLYKLYIIGRPLPTFTYNFIF